jgi:hypothetical protein
VGDNALKQLLVGFLVLLACASAQARRAPLSVLEVSRQSGVLNGKVIRVTGIVRNCQRLSCALLSPVNEQHFLSIGKSDSFDRAVQRVLGREIVIEATLNDRCVADFDHGVIPICVDRSNSLANPVLIRPRVK